MSLLDALMTLPPRETVRAKKSVAPWVKIEENLENSQKPKVRLSSSTQELIQSKNDYVLFREIEGVLYIVTPSPFSLDGDPVKKYDTRIGKSGRFEITKSVTETWNTDLSKFIGEYLLELVGEQELAAKDGENHLIKTFKLVSQNGNSNQPESTENESIENGLPYDESPEDGSEHGVSEFVDSVGREDGSDIVLSENSVF